LHRTCGLRRQPFVAQSASPARVELATNALGKRCSIQLSYGDGCSAELLERRTAYHRTARRTCLDSMQSMAPTKMESVGSDRSSGGQISPGSPPGRIPIAVACWRGGTLRRRLFEATRRAALANRPEPFVLHAGEGLTRGRVPTCRRRPSSRALAARVSRRAFVDLPCPPLHERGCCTWRVL
jgi:hypothetical protein